MCGREGARLWRKGHGYLRQGRGTALAAGARHLAAGKGHGLGGRGAAFGDREGARPWRLLAKSVRVGLGGMACEVGREGGGGGEEEFFNHYKNDPKRHAHTPSGDAGADLKSCRRREFSQRS